MNVIKILSIFSVFLLLFSCEKNVKSIVIPFETCEFDEIELKFEPVKNLSSSLRNQELSSIYFYEQKKQLSYTKDCYKKIINTINN